MARASLCVWRGTEESRPRPAAESLEDGVHARSHCEVYDELYSSGHNGDPSHGNLPRSTDYRARSIRSDWRIPSWSDAIEEAGLYPRQQWRLSEPCQDEQSKIQGHPRGCRMRAQRRFDVAQQSVV